MLKNKSMNDSSQTHGPVSPSSGPVPLEIVAALLGYDDDAKAATLMRGLNLPGPPYQRHHLLIALAVRHFGLQRWSAERLMQIAKRLRQQSPDVIRQLVPTLAKKIDQFLDALDAVDEGGNDG